MTHSASVNPFGQMIQCVRANYTNWFWQTRCGQARSHSDLGLGSPYLCTFRIGSTHYWRVSWPSTTANIATRAEYTGSWSCIKMLPSYRRQIGGGTDCGQLLSISCQYKSKLARAERDVTTFRPPMCCPWLRRMNRKIFSSGYHPPPSFLLREAVKKLSMYKNPPPL